MFEAAIVATRIADGQPVPRNTMSHAIFEQGKKLRRQVVEYICKHQNNFANAMHVNPRTLNTLPTTLPKRNRVYTYCRAMWETGCHGGELELSALARVLGRPVFVYARDRTMPGVYKHVVDHNPTRITGEPIMLYRDSRNEATDLAHYEALIPVSNIRRARSPSRNSRGRARSRSTSANNNNLRRAIRLSLAGASNRTPGRTRSPSRRTRSPGASNQTLAAINNRALAAINNLTLHLAMELSRRNAKPGDLERRNKAKPRPTINNLN